ncbi:primase-helicase family protein [Limibacter armeniacum]|uniref:primase-helicase family protein n=1 Tax=Limibacter armeniacum TaxID=466084 RepID=UPI002FE537CA
MNTSTILFSQAIEAKMTMDGKNLSKNVIIVLGSETEGIEGSLQGDDIVLVQKFYDLFNYDSMEPVKELTDILDKLTPEVLTILYPSDTRVNKYHPNKDLYKKPAGLTKQIKSFHKAFNYLTKRKGIATKRIVLKVIKADYWQQARTLDRMLFEFPDHEEEIIKSLSSEHENKWFDHVKLADGEMEHLYRYFGIDFQDHTVQDFYNIYNRFGDIDKSEFIYKSCIYQLIRGEIKKIKHVDADKYIQILDKIVLMSVQYLGENADLFVRGMQPTSYESVKRKYGADFIKDIPAYDGLALEPDNTKNYQRRFTTSKGRLEFDYYNVYEPLNVYPGNFKTAEEAAEACPNILSYFHHISQGNAEWDAPILGDRLTVLLDWFRIAYRYPKARLPMVILMSRERGTGKSTLLNLMRYIFGANAMVTDINDLLGRFNSHNAYKTYIGLEEIKVESERDQAMNMLKDLITGHTRLMEPKGVIKSEVSNFAHFIATSNHEDNIMKIDSDDEDRFFMLKPPVLQETKPNMLQMMKEEVPAFLSMLVQTPIHHVNPNARNNSIAEMKMGRLWFNVKHIQTEEFFNVIKHSKPMAMKEVETFMRDLFLNFNVQTVRIHPKVLCDLMKDTAKFKYSPDDIKRVFAEKGYKTLSTSVSFIYIPLDVEKDHKGNLQYIYYREKIKNTSEYRIPKNRYYELQAEDWLTPEEFERIKGKTIDDLNIDEENYLVETAKIHLNGNAEDLVFEYLKAQPINSRWIEMEDLMERFNRKVDNPIKQDQWRKHIQSFHDWSEKDRTVVISDNYDKIQFKPPF